MRKTLLSAFRSRRGASKLWLIFLTLLKFSKVKTILNRTYSSIVTQMRGKLQNVIYYITFVFVRKCLSEGSFLKLCRLYSYDVGYCEIALQSERTQQAPSLCHGAVRTSTVSLWFISTIRGTSQYTVSECREGAQCLTIVLVSTL